MGNALDVVAKLTPSCMVLGIFVYVEKFVCLVLIFFGGLKVQGFSSFLLICSYSPQYRVSQTRKASIFSKRSVKSESKKRVGL